MSGVLLEFHGYADPSAADGVLKQQGVFGENEGTGPAVHCRWGEGQ